MAPFTNPSTAPAITSNSPSSSSYNAGAALMRKALVAVVPASQKGLKFDIFQQYVAPSNCCAAALACFQAVMPSLAACA
jgi:hypothetical protein